MRIYRPKFCKCGCGNQVIEQLHHKYYGIPDYIRGHNNNRKGVKFSKELNEKMSLILEPYRFKKGQIGWNVGLKMSEKFCLNVSEGHKGQISWNKGFTKENDERILKLSKKLIGKKRSEETKKLKAFQTKELWQDPEYVQKQMKARGLTPNKTEIWLENLLDKTFPGEWKYVGDGEVIISGKCPDFININGQKKIIELFGDYWHKGQDPQDRIDIFSPYGYKTLVIWEKELKDFKSLRKKIFDFVVEGSHEVDS